MIVKDDRLNSWQVSLIPGHGLTGIQKTPPQNSKALWSCARNAAF